MKAKDHPEFDQYAPENFNWGFLDSLKVEAIACKLASAAHGQGLMVASQRNLLGGLRYALNVIAEHSEVV